MEIRLTPEQEAHILQMAAHEGKTAEQLIFDATVNFYDHDRHFLSILEERVRLADRGDFIEEDEMDARVQKMLRS